MTASSGARSPVVREEGMPPGSGGRSVARSRAGTRILGLLLVPLLAVGCAGRKPVSEEIFKDQEMSVKLVAQKDRSGDWIEKGFEHPWKVDDQTLNALLSSIVFNKGSVIIGRKKLHPAFPEAERERLLDPIREAFARANPDQYVEFAFHQRRSWTVFQRVYFTDGILFRKDGRLNCAFRNLGFEELSGIDGEYEPYRGDPTEKPARTQWRLVPQEGQFLTPGDGGGLFAAKAFTNWIQLDLNRPWEVVETPEVEEAPPESEPAAEEATGEEPAPMTKEEVQERIRFLEELYRDGALSEAAYREKRKALEAQYGALPGESP